jgi:hypothetical protein
MANQPKTAAQLAKEHKLNSQARLASADVVSIVHQEASGNDNRSRAIRNIKELLDLDTDQEAEAECNKISERLRDSDLTINFRAHLFFDKPPGSDRYFNQFESGSRQWLDDEAKAVRNEVEQKLMGYNRTNQAAYTNAVLPVNEDRINTLGSLGSVSFVPSVRPKYAALNYAELINGAASRAGRSFMVMKDHVKHKSTFLHSDSVDFKDVTNSTMLATFFNLDPLLANINERLLFAIQQKDQNTAENLAQNGQYIEAQMHTEIIFARDVKSIYLSMTEWQSGSWFSQQKRIFNLQSFLYNAGSGAGITVNYIR